MSEEYYEKDGKLYQKGAFSFLDKEVGEFEKNWDGTSSVKDWLNNEIATQSKPDLFDETDVTVHGQEGHFSEPGILDLSGNRPFTPNSEKAAPSEAESTSASTPSESSGGGGGGPGCGGCLMVSLGGLAICIIVLTTGWGPPFFDHLMLIFFAFCALVSYIGCRTETSSREQKIAFVVSTVIGLGIWYPTLTPFTSWVFKMRYPNGPSASDEQDLQLTAAFWVCIISPTIVVLAAWCIVSVLMKLFQIGRRHEN